MCPALPASLKRHLALWRRTTRLPRSWQRERAGKFSTTGVVMLSRLLLVSCMVGQVLTNFLIVLVVRRFSLNRMLEVGN